MTRVGELAPYEIEGDSNNVTKKISLIERCTKRKLRSAIRIIIMCVPAVALTGVDPCHAGTATANLTVNITITAGCTVTGSTLSFGSQSVLAANVDQTTTIGVQCTNTTSYNVGLDQGSHGTAVTAREMLGGATNTELINYQLFSDSGRTVNWGNTVGADTVTGTGNGAMQNITVFGQVPPQTTGTAGNYTDTVLITVTF